MPHAWNRRHCVARPITRAADRVVTERLEVRRLMAAFTVTNTGDNGGVNPAPGAGTGTLRQALVDVDASADAANTVAFAIPGVGDLTITVSADLPVVDVPVAIDGLNAGSVSATPTIEVTTTSTGLRGLELDGGNSSVSDLSIGGFDTAVLFADTAGGGDAVTGCYLGVALDGVSAIPNGFGIDTDQGAAIGGAAAGQGNVISGNTGPAVQIASSVPAGAATVQGNTIGLNAAGTAAVPNGSGVDLYADGTTIGGATPGQGNVISGNAAAGVLIDAGTDDAVVGNLIGTDAAGTRAIANGTDTAADPLFRGGVSLEATTGTVIGGTTAGAGNVISGNATVGVYVGDQTQLTTIQGNYVGTNAAGGSAVPNARDGIFVAPPGGGEAAPTGVTIGGTAAGAGNVISGNAANGVDVDGAAAGDVVEGNRIGTDATGMLPLGNAFNGVYDQGYGTAGLQVGGTAAGAGNVISANTLDGIQVSSDGTTTVADNLIGTAADGTLAADLGNGTASPTGTAGISFTATPETDPSALITGNTVADSVTGIFLFLPATATVGGPGLGQGNLVEANQVAGIDVSGGDPTIQGNRIVDNDAAGVTLVSGSAPLIGGPAAGDGNLISSNFDYGVEVDDDDSGAVIQGNTIGTTADGTAAAANGYGIDLIGSAAVLIGGTAPGDGNQVSGNTFANVFIDAASAHDLVQGNVIGGNATGTAALTGPSPGGTIGVQVEGADNAVGGATAAAGNVISFNTAGVVVSAAAGAAGPYNLIRHNSIFANGSGAVGGGIVLNETGQLDVPTPNDPGDADTGANDLQNSPVVVTAAVAAGQLTALTTLNSTPNTSFLIDFYSGGTLDSTGGSEGRTFVGTALATTDANGNATFTPAFASALTGTQYLTATATTVAGSPYGDTSQFSPPVQVSIATPTPTTPTATPTPTVSVGNVTQAEGNTGTTTFAFPVTLSAAAATPVTVQYATADGTATVADDDYVAAAGTLTIPAGSTTGTIDVTVVGDTKFEADETFTVTLSSPAGATLAAAAATGTIVNDDAAPTATIGNVTLPEGNTGTTAFNFPVTLSAVSGLPAVVGYVTVDGTATTADDDYQAATGQLVIPAGQTTGTITILVNGDTKFEPNETFSVVVSAISGMTFAPASVGVGTILNDDPAPTPPPTLSIGNEALAASPTGLTSFDFFVTRTGDASGTSTVAYATADGTARAANGDYQAATGTLTFGPGVATQTVVVNVAADAALYPTGTFSVDLSNPVGATVTSAVGTGTIAEPAPAVTPTATQLTGTVIGTAGSYRNQGNTRDKAFDGSLSTYFDAPTASGSYTGLDLGAADAVTQIKFAPRSGYAARMVGGVFQASNTPDFSAGVVTLYTVTATPKSGSLTTVGLTGTPAYRYVRYLGPTNGECNVAEVQFFGRAAAELAGTTIGTAGSYQNRGNTITKATDGNLSTFFDSAAANGSYVGLDLGTPTVATQVRFAPRSGYAARMVGGVFQASNTADFSTGTVTLGTITAAPATGSLTTLLLNDVTAYRYYRYLSPAGSYGNIAELEFDG